VVTEDVIRSLVVSQWLLETREIMVLHHTDCGLHFLDEEALRSRIEAESGARPAFRFGSTADPAAGLAEAVAAVRRCPYLRFRDGVRGFSYDVRTGLLREVVPLRATGGPGSSERAGDERATGAARAAEAAEG
jgi:carbonic anhydrase